jgi:hypothetical protein
MAAKLMPVYLLSIEFGEASEETLSAESDKLKPGLYNAESRTARVQNYAACVSMSNGEKNS